MNTELLDLDLNGFVNGTLNGKNNVGVTYDKNNNNTGANNDTSKHHYNLNAITNKEYSFEVVTMISNFLLEKIPSELKPKVGVVCGSGLGGLADRLTSAKVFPYETIPHFPKSTGKHLRASLFFSLMGCVNI